MARTIFFFAKIFDNDKYASDFVSGKLYANRLSYFRKLDETSSSNRGDKHEAIVGWHQSNQVLVTLNDIPLTDIVGPMSVQMNWHGNLNLFCIYAAHTGSYEAVSSDNLQDFKQQMKIPDDCLKLGQYAVLVTSVSQFIDRVKAAVVKMNYELKAGLVTYYDPESFSGAISEEESAFRKRDEYQHQREYRFCIDTGTVGDDPIVLDIGDIGDITLRCSTAEVNGLLQINLPDPENA